MRVVSLLPSATDILVAVGAGDLLVGRSHECNADWHGGDLSDLPVLTSARTAYDPEKGAADVDRQVREADPAAGLYELDEALLRDLQPDVIITQDLCDVCSIDLRTVERVAADLKTPAGVPPRIVSLDPETVEGILDDVLLVGDAVGRSGAAAPVVRRLRERMWRAQEFVNPYSADAGIVAFLEWTDPVFVAGHWTVQLIERAGGRHPWNETVPRPGSGAGAGPQQGERVAGKSVRVEPSLIAAVRPDWVVVAPCGLKLDETRAEAERLLDQDWFASLDALKAGRVALVDGDRYFNRPGPSVVDAFEWLVGWVQKRPELIPEGFAWAEFTR
ncbi:MAG: ABC transporter substrate-binding protein [Planctomycetota bacterium]